MRSLTAWPSATPCADVKPSDALKPRQVENFARLHLRDVPELLLKIDAYQGSAYTRLAMEVDDADVRAYH